MCGICGIVSWQKSIDSQPIQKMVANLRHRGPDDQGIFAADKNGRQISLEDKTNIWLGQTRLSILDLSQAGHQPMTNEDNSLQLVFNGEIYNFSELRAKLIFQGHQFKSNTDSEVLLHLYEQKGKAMLQDLRGMFAFAIWDINKKQLFAARDRLGIKPFYFSWHNHIFLFASATKTIIKSGLVPKKINPISVANYLHFLSVPGPLTIWEKISCLMPGHYLLWQPNKILIKKYWDLSMVKQLNYFSWPEVLDQTRNLLQDTIKQHLVADAPLGVFLSGGIDSSAIVALASQRLSRPLKTLSVTFQEKKFDERLYSRLISQKFKTEHQEICLNDRQVLASVPDFIQALDQPTGDGLNTYLISRAAKQAGLTVVLSGLGGDEVFGGYSYYQSLPKLYYYLRFSRILPQGLRKLMVKFLSVNNLQLSRISDLWSSPLDFYDVYLSQRTVFPATWTRLLLADKKLSPMTAENQLVAWRRQRVDQIKDNFNKISFLDSQFYLNQTLLVDTDVMSMANSLELRVPFLDHYLFEWLFSLPAKMKLSRTPKQLLVAALPEPLPKSLIQRQKMGFTFPFSVWLKDQWQPWLVDLVKSKSMRQNSYLNYQAIKDLLNLFLADRVSWSRLWTVIIFELWYQQNN